MQACHDVSHRQESADIGGHLCTTIGDVSVSAPDRLCRHISRRKRHWKAFPWLEKVRSRQRSWGTIVDWRTSAIRHCSRDCQAGSGEQRVDRGECSRTWWRSSSACCIWNWAEPQPPKSVDQQPESPAKAGTTPGIILPLPGSRPAANEGAPEHRPPEHRRRRELEPLSPLRVSRSASADRFGVHCPVADVPVTGNGVPQEFRTSPNADPAVERQGAGSQTALPVSKPPFAHQAKTVARSSSCSGSTGGSSSRY